MGKTTAQPARNAEIVRRHAAGESYTALAAEFGISHARARQIYLAATQTREEREAIAAQRTAVRLAELREDEVRAKRWAARSG